jgi:hypothetical protein
MRVIVCGSHRFGERAVVWAHLDRLHAKRRVSLVIQGGAKFIDQFAKDWAKARGVPCDEYQADWNKYGRKAGPIRNQRMIDEGSPNGVVAFPGNSGTADMIRRAELAGLTVWQPVKAGDKK